MPMMTQTGEYPYLKDDRFQAVSLPYGEGRLSLYLFLPNQGVSLSAFLENLNHKNWEQWMSLLSFARGEGTVTIPRFKLDYENTLNDALKALGMAVAFDRNQANFDRMRAKTTKRLFIHEVKHKTVMEVNEEGTEAAAATSVEMKAVSAPPPPFKFVVDRPFFATIHDNQTGMTLFLSAVLEPQ